MTSEWWSYRLSDFLLFAPRTYWRLFELHNAALWPLHVLMIVAGLIALGFALRRPGSGRAIAILLAVLWILVGWSFIWQRYAAINWAALYIAPLFLLQAGLLLVVGGRGISRGAPHTARRAIGGLLAGLAIAGYPLLAPLFGRPWSAAEVFGIAPDPTVIATLGFLPLLSGHRARLLYPIPLAWCIATGVTLVTLQESQGWIPLAAALLAVMTAIWPFQTRSAPQSSS